MKRLRDLLFANILDPTMPTYISILMEVGNDEESTMFSTRKTKSIKRELKMEMEKKVMVNFEQERR